MTWLYVAQMYLPDLPYGKMGPVKIGIAQDAEKRVHSLSLASPYPIDLLAKKRGSFHDEIKLHRRYAEDRLGGEWFQLSCHQLKSLGVGWIRVAGRNRAPVVGGRGMWSDDRLRNYWLRKAG